MGLNIGNDADVIEHLRKRLNAGWVFLWVRDGISATRIEDRCFTPGTDANADFELVMHPDMFRSFFILRPNAKFKKFMHGQVNDKTLALEELLLSGKRETGRTALFQAQDCASEHRRTEGVSAWMLRVFMPFWMDGGREGA